MQLAGRPNQYTSWPDGLCSEHEGARQIAIQMYARLAHTCLTHLGAPNTDMTWTCRRMPGMDGANSIGSATNDRVYARWSQNEPNNAGQDEGCVVWSARGWNDVPCTFAGRWCQNMCQQSFARNFYSNCELCRTVNPFFLTLTTAFLQCFSVLLPVRALRTARGKMGTDFYWLCPCE